MPSHAERIVHKVSGLLEVGVAAAQDPAQRELRKKLITNNPDRLRRTGANLIHYLAPKISRLTLHVLNRHYSNFGFQYIGSGGESSVLMNKDGIVIKIIRETTLMPPEDKQKRSLEIQELVDATTDCHGDTALQTNVWSSYTVGRRSYVALTQEFINGECAITNRGRYKKSLGELATRTLDTMVPNGLATDLLGAKNVLGIYDINGHPTGEIVIIDTVPLVKELRSGSAQVNEAQAIVWDENMKKLTGLAKG